jgi:hypothetical protein
VFELAKYLKKIISFCFLVVCALAVVSCQNTAGNKTDEEHEHVDCFTCGLCIDENCPGEESEKCPGHEIVNTHEHTPCLECGKCVDPECDGEASEKVRSAVSVCVSDGLAVTGIYAPQ